MPRVHVTPAETAPPPGRALLRVAALLLLWLVLTGGPAESWLFGGPAAALATLLALRLGGGQEQVRARLMGLGRFATLFLWDSVKGGLDIARRALHPRLPLSPVLTSYSFRLPPGPGRVAFADAISLLPGSLACGMDDRGVTVHLCDGGPEFRRQLVVEEERIAETLDLALAPPARS